MKKSTYVASLCALVSVALLAPFYGYASDADAARKTLTINKAKDNKPPFNWSDVAKWPDFTTGSWGDGTAGLATDDSSGKKITDLPITGAYRSSLDTNLHNAKVTSCEPLGLLADSGDKFYFTKDVILIASHSAFNSLWRRVYLDGRGHPENLPPSYFGHSIGHWEDDTLVIDTVGIGTQARLARGLKINSGDTHIIERIRLIKPDTLEIHKTIINTDVFTQPIDIIKQLPRLRDHEFSEADCRSEQVDTDKPL